MLAAAGEGRQLSADNFTAGVRLTDEQRLDWLRLIRSDNVGPRGIMAQTPQTAPAGI
jgi:DprA-like N-terminal HHH domain